MIPQFKNMNELTEYLSTLETRVRTLEADNARLRGISPAREGADESTVARYVARMLPQTNLLSPSFFTRALAVWGHFMVINIIVGVIFMLLYLCLIATMFGSLVQSQS
jgi:hypothetical protein